MKEDEILARLDQVHQAEKSFDSPPIWVQSQERTSAILSCQVSLRLNGILTGGASIRIRTPLNCWEEDVYGQIEVRLFGLRRQLRLSPVEWKPMREHRNPATAPEELRYLILEDRYHPYELNRPLGVNVFYQTLTGVAAPLPQTIANFQDYASLCAEIWNCPDMGSVPPPPWSRSLI